MSERVKVITKDSSRKKNILGTIAKKTNSRQLQPKISLSGQILRLQRTIGNRAVERLIKSGTLQAKLKIGKPNDIYEQEADKVADQVMKMSEQDIQRQPEEDKEEIHTKSIIEKRVPVVHRKTNSGQIQRMCDTCSMRN